MVDISFTMVMQWLNFGALVFILYHILYKPLLKFLDARAEEIKGNLDEAAERNAKANESLQQYEAKIKAVEQEAEKFMEGVKHDALKEKHKILERAESEAEATIDRARKEISAEIESAKSDLRKEFSSMAVHCAERILEKEVNEKQHADMINKFLHSEIK